jgi:hypothetical protein
MDRSLGYGANGGRLLRSVPEGSAGERLELLETGGLLEDQMDARRERGWKGMRWGESRERDHGENMENRIEACLEERPLGDV